jgi:hypothetical protein
MLTGQRRQVWDGNDDVGNQVTDGNDGFGHSGISRF